MRTEVGMLSLRRERRPYMISLQVLGFCSSMWRVPPEWRMLARRAEEKSSEKMWIS
jgi:hypothetical protein